LRIEPGALSLYLTAQLRQPELAMTTFDDRQKAFEAKFAHDADLKFKVAARRDKLVGLWAAGKLGLSGDAADAYAKSTVIADLEEAGDEDVVRKLVADLDAKGVAEAEVRAALAEQGEIARRQIMEAM
jgi:hypothetical protein